MGAGSAGSSGSNDTEVSAYEKEITKQQIQKWKSHSIKKLIFRINEIELNVKKNINNSVYLVSDFLLKQS